jgi:general stress protein 26
MNATNAPQHLEELLAGFDNAMLVTRRSDGQMRSRPMAIVEVRGDGAICFATAIDSPKTEELERDPHVNVALQSVGRFVSITGTGRILTDRALLDRLWSESWRVWFPGGRDDPSLCLLAVEAEEAEFWDRSGGRGFKYLFQAAKAYLSGTQPPPDGEQHGKVKA